jgi:hypothetical protein
MYGPRGVPSDARQAVAIAWLLRPHSRKAARELLRVRRHESRLRVNSDAHLIRAVAARLLEVGALSGSEVENVIEETLRAQWRRRLEKINGIQNQTIAPAQAAWPACAGGPRGKRRTPNG